MNSAKTLCFKNDDYLAKKGGQVGNRKSRFNKTLKQIIGNEKPLSLNRVTYASINAPSSSKPNQKQSDLSGFPTNYKDPQTKLYFFDCKEFSIIRSLKNDVINGYLELRKANF